MELWREGFRKSGLKRSMVDQVFIYNELWREGFRKSGLNKDLVDQVFIYMEVWREGLKKVVLTKDWPRQRDLSLGVPVIVLDIFQNWCDIYKVAKMVHENWSVTVTRDTAVHTTARAVLVNTQLPSLPNTHTHAHTRTHICMHTRTHATCTLSLCCVFCCCF